MCSSYLQLTCRVAVGGPRTRAASPEGVLMDNLLFIFGTAVCIADVHVGHVLHILPFGRVLAAGKMQACQVQISDVTYCQLTLLLPDFSVS